MVADIVTGMATLHITRGLPASGKTTWATQWVAQQPDKRVRANRDSTRQMLFGMQQGLSESQENTVTKVLNTTVTGLLKAGFDVVVDDMNLRAAYVARYSALATATGARMETHVFNVEVDTAVLRDAERPDGIRVGEAGIRALAARFTDDGMIRPVQAPPSSPAAKRTQDPRVVPVVRLHGLPEVVICDIDGTVALMQGRSPYDWSKVGGDAPNQPVIDALARLADGRQVLFMSGRSDVCWAETQTWLHLHIPPTISWSLHMRAAADNRPDRLTKSDLFDAHVRGRFNVAAVLDDRNQVVRLWRDLGLTCLQVADGDF